jgi:hypothetical protein
MQRLYLEEAARAIAHVAADQDLKLTAAGLDAAPNAHANGTALGVHAVATALRFIDSTLVCRQSRVTRRSWNSCVLKHQVERWGAKQQLEAYVSNGAVIAAALWRAIPIERVRSGPNAVFAVKLARAGSKQAKEAA